VGVAKEAAGKVRLTLELYIYRTAELVIEEHDGEASIEVAMRADEMFWTKVIWTDR